MMLKNIKSIYIYLSIILYLLSLCFPAIGCDYFDGDKGAYTVLNGFEALLIGPLGFLMFNPAWIANLSYLTAIFILLKNIKNAPSILFLAIASLVLGLSTFLLYLNINFRDSPLNLYVGFYFWIGGFLMLLIYGITHKEIQ